MFYDLRDNLEKKGITIKDNIFFNNLLQVATSTNDEFVKIKDIKVKFYNVLSETKKYVNQIKSESLSTSDESRSKLSSGMFKSDMEYLYEVAELKNERESVGSVKPQTSRDSNIRGKRRDIFATTPYYDMARAPIVILNENKLASVYSS